MLAIEPFLSPSATHAVIDRDGWTLRTADAGLAAQYEHTVVVTAGAPLVLTSAPRTAQGPGQSWGQDLLPAEWRLPRGQPEGPA